jgi:hypothetical protein
MFPLCPLVKRACRIEWIFRFKSLQIGSECSPLQVINQYAVAIAPEGIAATASVSNSVLYQATTVVCKEFCQIGSGGEIKLIGMLRYSVLAVYTYTAKMEKHELLCPIDDPRSFSLSKRPLVKVPVGNIAPGVFQYLYGIEKARNQIDPFLIDK